jgi:hypothetical protein
MSRTKRRAPHKSSLTRTSIQGEVAPRLPHETDESSDSQMGAASNHLIRQAYEDVTRGLVDTDRGAPMDELYARTLRPGRSKVQARKMPKPK